jgi:hypothetical protein
MLMSLCVSAADKDLARRGYLVVTDYVAADGKTDVSDALQKLINENPNRTLYFPDGTYLISKPIATPAEPTRSVDLRLSNYAKIKATPDWKHQSAMVCLGGIYAANNILTPGSNYSFTGGIIDGSGVANGISIDSGRETVVADVSMKGVVVGLHIKRGVNNGSSDADIRNVNIVGNNALNSIGVLIDGHDNTLSNMRIFSILKGVVINGNGNCLRDIHPLVSMKKEIDFYNKTVGFEINSRQNWLDFCYSDQFAIGFKFGKNGGGILDKCFCFWYYSRPGMRHVGFSSHRQFNAQVKSPTVTFHNNGSTNCLIEVGRPGGVGFIRDADTNFINDPRDMSGTYRRY